MPAINGSQDADRGMPKGIDRGPGRVNPAIAAIGTKEADVSTPSAAWMTMLPKWNLISTVLAGTESMRAAGKTYLPSHPYESEEAYNERNSRATLKNYTLRTLDNLTSKAFRDSPKPNDDVPQEILDLMDDIDAEGSAMTVFARAWFRLAVERSFAFVLVDYSTTAPTEAAGAVANRTLEDDRKEGVRPFWRLIDPLDVIHLRVAKIDGKVRFSEVRIREWEVEADGFVDKYLERIRVLTPGAFELWEKRVSRKGAKPKWVKIDSGTMDLPYIPLVSFYTSRTGLGEGKPPLEDLAYLNVEHFQSSADQRSILTVARFPILAVSGVSNTDPNSKPVVIGPKQWLSVADPQGRIYYVEHAGNAIAAGRTDLEDIEDQMASYGSEFLRKRPGASSATGRALDSAEAISPLMAWGMDFKDALEVALQFTADWLKVEDGGTVAYEIKADITVGESKELDVLDKARARKDLSRKTFLSELKRRDILSTEFDEEKDAKEIDEEPVDETPGMQMSVTSTPGVRGRKTGGTDKRGPARTTGEPPVTTA